MLKKHLWKQWEKGQTITYILVHSVKISYVVPMGKALEQRLWDRGRASHRTCPQGAWALNRKVRQVYEWLLNYKITTEQRIQDAKTQAPLQRHKSSLKQGKMTSSQRKGSPPKKLPFKQGTLSWALSGPNLPSLSLQWGLGADLLPSLLCCQHRFFHSGFLSGLLPSRTQLYAHPPHQLPICIYLSPETLLRFCKGFYS